MQQEDEKKKKYRHTLTAIEKQIRDRRIPRDSLRPYKDCPFRYLYCFE